MFVILQYNELIISAKQKHQKKFSELSEETLELLEKHFS